MSEPAGDREEGLIKTLGIVDAVLEEVGWKDAEIEEIEAETFKEEKGEKEEQFKREEIEREKEAEVEDAVDYSSALTSMHPS